jgi:hypothetical protein
MRLLVTAAVLLAVVSTALVAVCQHTETRRLQYRVWQLERRSERLERARLRLGAAVAAGRTPRRLLEDQDARGDGLPPALPDPQAARASAPETSGWIPRGGPAFEPLVEEAR